MRKVLSTIVMAAFGVAAFAQAPTVTNTPSFPGYEKEWKRIQNDAQPSMKRAKVAVEDWFLFPQDFRNFAGGITDGFFQMFPDTFVKNVFLNSDNNEPDESWNAWCSMGTAFDPHETAWENQDLVYIRDWFPYTVDSVFFDYGYFRSTDSTIVDTMVVQVYRGVNNNPFPGQMTGVFSQSTIDKWAIASYDRDLAIGKNYTEIIKIPLQISDTTLLNAQGTFRSKRYGVDINDLDMKAGEVLGVTVTYLPGSDYQMGDTLNFDEDLLDFNVKAPVKKLNRFGLIVSSQQNTITNLGSFNNGMFIVRWNRYEDGDNIQDFMKGKYYLNSFGNNTNTYRHYPKIGFHVKTEYDTGIEDVKDGNGLGKVYPNPATKGSEMKVSFALKNKERVSINVYDLTGKQVKTIVSGVYTSGEHTVNFNASDLQPGMYLYTMQAGSYVKSQRFTIVE